MKIPESLDVRTSKGFDYIDTKLIWGKVTSVNLEAQTMNIRIPGDVDKIVSNIPINNSMTLGGIGFRFIPIPNETSVILYEQNGVWYHIGYYLKDLSSRELYGLEEFTESKKSDKSDALLLQRYLEMGEVQIVSISRSEIYLSNDGSILIKDANNDFLKLDCNTNTFEGNYANIKQRMDGVILRGGNTRRSIDPDTKEEDYVNYTEEEKSKEFTVMVGLLQDEFGLDYSEEYSGLMLSPFVGILSLANNVYNESGEEELLYDTPLHFLLRTGTGAGFGINEDGIIYINDYISSNYVKFTTGDTSLEIKINDSTTTINTDGELTFTNPQSTISIDKSGNIKIISSTSIEIKSGDASIEKSTLGETLKEKLDALMDLLIAHQHNTGVGPSQPPITASDFTALKGELPEILSAQVKNN
jgi:hypothetical protein